MNIIRKNTRFEKWVWGAITRIPFARCVCIPGHQRENYVCIFVISMVSFVRYSISIGVLCGRM
ncbi:MAG: hypothetical protein CMA56_03810 [Euryarchaeota archaeon]|nr:hypothetical protein [Euryarchaeota archaeon]